MGLSAFLNLIIPLVWFYVVYSLGSSRPIGPGGTPPVRSRPRALVLYVVTLLLYLSVTQAYSNYVTRKFASSHSIVVEPPKQLPNLPDRGV